MLKVGLTGGIGAGKSTLAALLVERGAQVVDADRLGREALAPGRPAWQSVVGQFGEEVLAASSMEIDRKRLADEVFADPNKLAALNAIVHPVIFSSLADELEHLKDSDAIVMIDAAVLLESGMDKDVDVVVVVTAKRDVRTERLMRGRGMSRLDIDRRIAAQTDPREARARADITVVNDGSLEDLAAEADRVWLELMERRGATA